MPTPHAPASTGPLAGLTVVDLSTIISGGTATSMLADLGALVIKVEHPRGGDPLRSWGPFISGQSVWWKVVSRNKKSVTLNLSEPRGRHLLTDLAKRADVLVENFRPGTMERWGLAPEALLEQHPRLVILRISGFGQTGPFRHRAGFGTVAEAMSGIVAVSGFPDSPPLLPPMPLADEVAGLTGALSVLAAIHHRAASNRGQVIDVSLYEPLFRLLIPHVTQYTSLGLLAQRTGNYFSDAAPRNLYRSGDGTWIALSATSQRVFERLAAAIGRPDLLEDERFKDNTGRVRHREELDAILSEWMAARSEQAILERLGVSGAVAGPVYDVPRILNDPHYAERQDVIAVRDPDLGDLQMVGVVPKFSATPGAVTHPGPRLGEHNREIYGDWLGLDDTALARLAEEGVV
jgi:crotonobetainyl-CoA:carnitine CoA-transferase CaiB-like acyl-CoA transferase